MVHLKPKLLTQEIMISAENWPVFDWNGSRLHVGIRKFGLVCQSDRKLQDERCRTLYLFARSLHQSRKLSSVSATDTPPFFSDQCREICSFNDRSGTEWLENALMPYWKPWMKAGMKENIVR